MKTVSSLQFRIDQLRKDKMIYALESIAVTLLLTLMVFVIPTIVRFIFTKTQADEPAPILVFLDDYTPLIAGVFAFGFFVFAMIGNEMRVRKIHVLEKELDVEMLAEDGCGRGGDCECGHDHHHHHDYEEEVMLMDEEPVKKTLSKKKKSK